MPHGPSRSIGGASIQFPDFDNAKAKVVGNSVKASGRSNFIDLTVGLDGIAQLPTSGTFNLARPGAIPDISGSHDLLDLDFGPSLGFSQTYDLSSVFMVDFLFSRLVNIAGVGAVSNYSGAWNSLPDMWVRGVTTFSPTFWLQSNLKTTAGLDLSSVLTVKAAQAKILGIDIGPLYNKTFRTSKSLIPLVSRDFALSGFGSVTGAPNFHWD